MRTKAAHLTPTKFTGQDLGLMFTRLPSFFRIFQTGLSQLYRRGEPDLDPSTDDWKYPKKKPLLYVPNPLEGCSINSLPPEILSWIFVLGQRADLDPEPSRYAAEPGSRIDSGG